MIHPKPATHLLPPDALLAVARVLAHGAEKHGARGWEEGRASSKDYGALLRHLLAWRDGQDLDPQSGETHLAHAAARALILLAGQLRGLPGTDDR